MLSGSHGDDYGYGDYEYGHSWRGSRRDSYRPDKRWENSPQVRGVRVVKTNDLAWPENSSGQDAWPEKGQDGMSAGGSA